MAKTKTAKPGVVMKTADFPVPQTLEQATDMLAKLGDEQREAESIAGRADAEVTRIRQAADEMLTPLLENVLGRFMALQAFAEARRNELTDDGKKKSVKLPSGELKWRTTPPTVEIEDEEAFLQALAGTEHFERFARNKTFVDKNALKKDAEIAATLAGVTITQGEEFRVKPESGTGEINAAAIHKLLKAGG